MPNRESADLFWHLKRYGVKNSLRRKLWREHYFLHDTFGKRWNRAIGCRFKHKKVRIVEDDETGKWDRVYCFACEREKMKEE